MPPLEDESSPTQYTPQWRSALYALRLIGRLHDLKRNDPKPAEMEEPEVDDLIASLPLPNSLASPGESVNRIERKRTIIIRRKKG